MAALGRRMLSGTQSPDPTSASTTTQTPNDSATTRATTQGATATQSTQAATATQSTQATPRAETQQPPKVTNPPLPQGTLQPGHCVLRETTVTHYTQATEDTCSTSYPCLCSCMIVLVDEYRASAATTSIFVAGLLTLAALVL